MTVQDYFIKIPPERINRFKDIRNLITSLYPKTAGSLDYKMPTCKYGQDWIAIANQKQYISLYTCSAEHIIEFKEKYPSIKSGKGCLNLKDTGIFPINDLIPAISNVLESKPIHQTKE